MRARTRIRGVAALLAAVTIAVGASPVIGRSHVAATPVAAARTADLGAYVDSRGSFRSRPGADGSVDASAWTLVSDLASGEAPRFARSSRTAPSTANTPTGPWSGLGSNGSGDGALKTGVFAVAVIGPDLYVGGNFHNAAGIPEADYVAMWDGSAWSALGSNHAGDGALNGRVWALAVQGTTLFVGGEFTNADTMLTADRIAQWNGSAWDGVASSLASDGEINGVVRALAVVGTVLYAGGAFTAAAGDANAGHLARWDGSHWSAVGDDGSGGPAVNDWVFGLAVDGLKLYVAGVFTDAGGIATADEVARWQGNAWHALGSDGSGNGAIPTSTVFAVAAAGKDVYLAGDFVGVAGAPKAVYVAHWDGTSWSALGKHGPVAESEGDAYALTLDGGDLYVGGHFNNVGGNAAADYIARWNGSSWSALGSNGHGDGALDFDADALLVAGGTLDVGGEFADAGGHPTADVIAQWALPRPSRPDGRIQLGTGALAGNDVYGTTGAGQSRTGSAAPGHSISFGVSVQNDGTSADRFKVKATGAASSGYAISYKHGSTDLTAAVVAGTYRTPNLAPGAAYLISVSVGVKPGAPALSSVTRLVTLTSVANSAAKDAVQLVGKRS